MTGQSWPSVADYCAAIVEASALDDSAGLGSLERTIDGEPRAYSGAFATVFHFENSHGDTALRCYTRAVSNLERRYHAINELLSVVRTDTLRPARYRAHGIRVGSTWWPAVTMDWIAGRPLNEEVAARIGDGDALIALAARFRDLVRELGVLGIAHGDLQHRNILVSDGALRLIDYDAMFVPALAGLAQGEYGHRNYQHHGRVRAAFDGKLDRFSSLVIYTALTALAADFSLWKTFDDGDNLLFRAHDFSSRGESALFKRLLASTATRGLALVLIEACRAPFDAIPTLEQAIADAAGTIPARQIIDRAGPPAPGPRLVPPPRPRATLAPTPVPPTVQTLASRPRRARLPSFAVLAPATVIIGLGIGVALGAWPGSRPMANRHSHPATAAIASAKPAIAPMTARPAPRVAVVTPHAVNTAQPTPRPVATPVPTPAPTATPEPSVTPTTIPGAVRAVTATQSPQTMAGLAGAWTINEANRLVGTMVWSGPGTLSSNGAIVLNAHKDSIAGRAASACERETNLHAAVVVGAAQTVPFQEVNCQGTTMSGQVRIASFSRDKRSFSGSFWEDGVKIGDFVASKQ